MKENIKSLEKELNRIIDVELAKDVSRIDDRLVMACCDGLLRMEKTDRYMITASEMKESIDSLFRKKQKPVTKLTKKIKILLIAAIIAILLAIGSLGYSQYKYNIFNFSDHSTVLFDNSRNKRVGDFTLSYIPDGFTLNYESDNKYEHSREYTSESGFFTVTKQSNINEIDINTEYKGVKVQTVGGIDYIEFGESEHGQGVVWEEDGYKYIVSGNVSSQLLLKIATSVSND